MDSGLVALFGRASGPPLGIKWGGRARAWEIERDAFGWAVWTGTDWDMGYPSWREALAAVRAAEEGR